MPLESWTRVAIASAAATSCAASSASARSGAEVASCAASLQVDGHGDQVLLSTVVDVALEATSGRVLRVDEPFARLPQLRLTDGQLGQPLFQRRPQLGAAKNQPGLGGQAREEPFLHPGQRRPGPLPQHAATRAPRSRGGRSAGECPGPSPAIASAAPPPRAATWPQWRGARPRTPRPAPTPRRCPRQGPSPCAAGGPPEARLLRPRTENRRRASYGEVRPRWTTRAATPSRRVSTGSNARATTAVASTERPRLRA